MAPGELAHESYHDHQSIYPTSKYIIFIHYGKAMIIGLSKQYIL